MNKTAARLVGFVVVAALIVGIVVFARQKGGRLRFALIPKSVGHSYWEGVREGMNAAAEEHGVKAVFHGPSAANIDEQIRIIENFITQGYDGISISPNDPNSVKEVIKRAMDKGIAVVTFDSDSPQSDRLLYIGTDNREAGRVGGREMIKLLGAKPRPSPASGTVEGTEELLVQIIGGNQGAWNLNERIEGFQEAVQGTTIKLCNVLFNEENQNKSLEVAENAITAHPNLRGFFGSNAFAGPGTALAIKGAIQRGRIKPGQVRVVAFDTTDEILNYVEEGIIDCTLAQQTRLMGKLSIEKLLEFAKERRQTGRFTRPPKGKDVIDTGVAVVRREDVRSYRTTPVTKK